MPMDVAIELRKRLRAIVWPLAFACIALYFGVHLVQNEHGLMALQAYDQRLEEATARLGALTKERVSLERQTAQLAPGQMHPDFLGEHARQRLGMGRADEAVILGR